MVTLHVKKPNSSKKGWPVGFWLYKSDKARKKAGPKGPLGPSPSLKQQKVQNMLQLLYANKALQRMRKVRIVAGAAWDEATTLRNVAMFARKAMASPFPPL
jgi:hypothetical protein